MLRVTSELNNLNTIRDYVESQALALGMSPDDVYAIILATDEAATNLCIHGYPKEPGPIEVAVEHDAQNFIVKIRDTAPSFDPLNVPPPDLTSPLEERPLGGLGIHFMKHYTDELTYRATHNGNELVLKKRIRGDKKQ